MSKSKVETVPTAEHMLHKRIVELFPIPSYAVCSFTPDGIDLSSVTIDEASLALGFTKDRIGTFLAASGVNAEKEERIDIRYLYAVRHGQIGHAADPYEVALAQYRIHLIESGGKLSPKLTPCLCPPSVTNIFRQPHHRILQLAGREVARRVLRFMLINAINRYKVTVQRDPFVFEEIIALPDDAGDESTADGIIVPGVRLRVDLSDLPEGRSHSECLEAVSKVAGKADSEKCDFMKYSNALIFTDDILQAEKAGAFAIALYRCYKADPDIKAWFDVRRIGWPKSLKLYLRKISDKATEMFPVAEDLRPHEIAALITLFGDASTFFDDFGHWVRPADPHGSVPKRYQVNRKVWREWCARTEEIT